MTKRIIYCFGLIGFIALGIGMQSCEEDVDLLAPYKATPVIFGVLDYTADTQFVRINKTYLGAGDANVYAEIKDSVEYDPSEVEVWLIKKDLENAQFGIYDILDSIQLQFIELPFRDPGLFYNQDVGFYYTTEDLFTPEELSNVTSSAPGNNTYFYEIKATIRGQVYRGQTDFPTLSPNDIDRPLPIGTPGVPRQQYYLGDNYQQIAFAYKNRERSERYQCAHRIVYDYNTTDGGLVTDQISDFQLGVRGSGSTGETSDITFNTQSIYEFFGNQIKSNPDIQKVRIKRFEFRVTAASESLDTYIEVANPISDFTPVLTSYTNLDNGAIGILGARATVSREFYISEMSLQQFNEGPETTDGNGSPCYCVEGWPGTVYICGAGPDC
jgi:hypothetical protein